MSASNERRYAENTKVTVEKTVIEIKNNLKKYGATAFAQVETPHQLAVEFLLNYGDPDERRIRFIVDLPQLADFEKTRGNQTRSRAEQGEAYNKEQMRLWRALSVGIKGKLIMVDENIETMEEAFYAHVVLPSGRTVYEETHEVVAQSYERKLMPPIPLLALPEAKGR